jgi:hypothetical protein
LAGGVAAALGLCLLSESDAASAFSPSGSQFQVNTYTTSYQSFPSVASDSAGNLVVVWDSFGSADSDTSFTSIEGQRYLPEPSFVPSLGATLAMVVVLARRRQRSCLTLDRVGA